MGGGGAEGERRRDECTGTRTNSRARARANREHCNLRLVTLHNRCLHARASTPPARTHAVQSPLSRQRASPSLQTSVRFAPKSI
eukprot:6174759-Pleurochrysis_carterae.AAC.1